MNEAYGEHECRSLVTMVLVVCEPNLTRFLDPLVDYDLKSLTSLSFSCDSFTSCCQA